MGEQESGPRVNPEDVAKRQPPLAKVMEALAEPEGKTRRDSPTATARDIALLMEARDASSPLASALDELERAHGGKASEDDLKPHLDPSD
ncbi:MAG TPA: hypothetical protein VF517_10680 [Thermoleophilaceae bacterium]|jgi:hypothetical protein